MSFNHPAVLWLLLLLIPLFIWLLRSKNNGGASYSSISLLENLPSSTRQKMLWLPPLLQILALAASIIALAQPYAIQERYAKKANGIAISLVVDISTSMRRSAKDGTTRMEMANQVLQEFILGNGKELGGRENDLISIITFARYPDTISPLTTSHKTLAAMAEDIEVTNRPNEDSTAYGDAVALAAAQLNEYEKSVNLKNDQIKSKIVILLTDGENNSGQFDPLAAAAMAQEWGIKIYTISLGDPQKISLGKSVVSDQSDSDWGLLAMAETTGGIFQRAHGLKSLQKVYQAIDKLEKSQLHDTLFEDKVPQFHWFVLAAIFGFFGSGLLNATWLRVAKPLAPNKGNTND